RTAPGGLPPSRCPTWEARDGRSDPRRLRPGGSKGRTALRYPRTRRGRIGDAPARRATRRRRRRRGRTEGPANRSARPSSPHRPPHWRRAERPALLAHASRSPPAPAIDGELVAYRHGYIL